MSRDFVIQKLEKQFGGDLIVLSSPGYANNIAFKCQAALQLKAVKEDDDADMSVHISKVAKEMIRECKGIHLDRSPYKLNLDVTTAQESVSDVLMTLLEAISPKLSHALPALMIGNIITFIIRNQPTDLQVTLGALLRDSKALIGYMHDSGITYSYDEVLRFRKSAAKSCISKCKYSWYGLLR